MPGPLAGHRVVDLSAMITGPQATLLLGDQGAEVIKVEPPGFGDLMRLAGTQRGGISALFASLNRSKRSIAVDLRQPEGRDIVKRLVSEADVFVQNFRPGVVERLGLDEPTLRAVQPDLVYVSISAYGPTGPLAKRGAYDHILQGLTGMATIQSEPGSGRPQYVRNAFCDKITGYTAAQAITAALLARERGQGGQHLRISMLDATLAFLWPDGMANHTILEDDVALLPTVAQTYRFIEATDGFVSVAAITDAQWHGIFRAADRPELVDDPRFATGPERAKHLLELIEELRGGRVDLPAAEVLERLVAEDVPCGPILTLDEMIGHPQVIESATLVESDHPVLGRVRQPRHPARFDRTPADLRLHAPALGEHTDAVLSALGMSPGEIEDLRAKNAVA